MNLMSVEELNALWARVEPRLNADTPPDLSPIRQPELRRSGDPQPPVPPMPHPNPPPEIPDWPGFLERERDLEALYRRGAGQAPGRECRRLFRELSDSQRMCVKKLSGVVFLTGGDPAGPCGGGVQNLSLPDLLRFAYREETGLLARYGTLSRDWDALQARLAGDMLRRKEMHAARLVHMAETWFR